MYHSPEDIADIVSLVIVAVCAVATFALCITGTKVKARGDLARKAVPSYHSTTWLYFIHLVVATISRSISVASIYEKRIRSPFRSTERISLFAALTWHLSIAALILCITDLAVGLKLVVTGRTSRKFRIFIKVVAVLIVLLAVTFFALAQWTFSTDSFVGSVVVAILGVTILALHLIGDLSIAIFATRQRITIAKSQSPLTGCANRILGAAWFGFFLFAWSIIHTFTIPLVAVDSQYGYLAYDIVDLILGSFGTLGIFVLLFQVIRRDTAGLWSGSASVRPKDQGEVSA